MNNCRFKFRVWDKSTNNWLNDTPSLHCFSEYYLDLEGGGLVRFDGSFTDHEERYSRANSVNYYFKGTKLVKECPYVIQQWTGLVDKNNKEIYEGDIIQYPRLFDKEGQIKTLISFIRYEDAKFGFDLIGFNGMFFDLGDEPHAEVIGNIFENKELLN